MAVILDFPAHRAKPAAPRRRRRGKTAEIVIFPGVRYERWRASGAGAGKAAKTGKRDTRRLVDA